MSDTFLWLQNLLTSNPSLASIFSTKEKLLPLFECFSVPVASESNIHQLCLSIMSLLTAYAPCLEAMVADGSSLLLLLQMLRSAPNCREGVLHVLYALASTAELAWAAAKHGGVVYILELLLPLQGNELAFPYFFFPDGTLYVLLIREPVIYRGDSLAAKSSSSLFVGETCWAANAWA